MANQRRVSHPGVAIHVEGLGVQYSLKFTRRTTLRRSLTRNERNLDAGQDPVFWALRDVSFEVPHGQSLGVIGPNGAGKSTLLQVLAGIITPSAGVVEVDGHISSLLTLGAGFDQDLNGIDNIRLAGAFMGIPHRELEERLPGMVEYADLGKFIDQPIKTYSAGMKARLGFAIATSVEPDILLLDEVLATGDASFREKSKQRVMELVQAAKAIVLVTHDMNWVTEYCNKAMLLEQGRIVAVGDPADVVKIHEERSAQRRAAQLAAGVLPVAPPAGPSAGGSSGSGAPPASTAGAAAGSGSGAASSAGTGTASGVAASSSPTGAASPAGPAPSSTAGAAR